MKWLLLKFLLIVIFVAKYQGVTGLPRNVPDHAEWNREETYTSLEDIRYMEVEDLKREMKSDLNSRDARALKFFPFSVPTFNESFDFLSMRLKTLKNSYNRTATKLKMLKNSYDRTRADLENIIKRYALEYYIRKDTKGQSVEIVASDEMQQVNTAQVASTPDESIVDQSHKSYRLINNPFKDMPAHIINYMSVKMELLKLTYEEMIENFQDIINYVKNRVIKDKDTKDKPEITISGNKTQVTQTTSTPTTSRPTTSRPTTSRPTTSRPTTSRPATSTSESVDNQQSTSTSTSTNENDKKDKFENHKETSGSSEKGDGHTGSNNAKDKDQSTFENIAMSGNNAAETISTQGESVNQPISSQSVPSKNYNEFEKFEDNKESSESTASSNETQENSIQIYPTSNKLEQNENFEDVEDMAFFV